MRRIVLIAAALALPVALVVAGVGLRALIDNNNQGEAFDTVTGAMDWPYILTIGVTLFVPSFAVAFVAFLLIGLGLRAAFGRIEE